MRILHVLSQTELTGSEVYAAQLGFLHAAEGHELFYISDKLHVEVPGRVIAQPISKRGWPRRIANIRFLRAFAIEHKIDVVHAHSRAASWLCHWAFRGLPLAYVSTVHGRQHLHRSSRAYGVYGDRTIAVCENVKRHLVREMGMDASVIRVIPNGMSPAEMKRADVSERVMQLAVLGRTSGPKGERTSELINQILPDLMAAHSELRFEICGGPQENLSRETRARLEALSTQYPGRVRVRGYVSQQEIRNVIAASSLVVASGRVAITAASVGTPTIALGEATCHGLLNEQNIFAAIRSNFGDILADREMDVDLNLLRRSLQNFFRVPHEPAPMVAETVRRHFDLARVGKRVSDVYLEALAARRLPKRIPILMYHKVVEEGYSSPHKTYVSEASFRLHMESLQRFGFQTVTFADLRAAALGEKTLPEKPVVITFDDGYRGTHQRALPVLKKLGQRAVFYLLGDRSVPANHWDDADAESPLISDEQVKELVAAGMEVGAHSLTHRHMSQLSPEEAFEEALRSKEVLEKLTGTALCSYAYPYGDLSEEAKEAVQAAGFSFAVATDSGGLSFAQDLFHLFRVNIFPQDGLLQLYKKTHAAYRPYYAWKRGK